MTEIWIIPLPLIDPSDMGVYWCEHSYDKEVRRMNGEEEWGGYTIIGGKALE